MEFDSRHKPIIAWAAFVVAALFFLFEFVARIEPSLATSEMAADFGLSRAGFGVLSSLFFWVYAPMQIVVGLLLDRFGARRLVLPAILVCALGVATVGLVSSPVLAGVGRLATGFGASFAFVGALYVVNHWFPSERFAVLSGVVNAVGMLGTAVGAVVLTGVVGSIGWRPTFLATGAFGLLIFALAVLLFRDAPAQQEDVEVHDSPLGPLYDILRDSQVWLIAVIGALLYLPINVYGGLWGNSELAQDHGLSPIAAETAVSLLFWGMAAGSIGAGALSDRLGHRKWIVFGGGVAAAVIWSGVLFSGTGSLCLLAVLLFLAGLFGGAQMLTFAMARDGQDARSAGTAIAFVNMVGIGAALVFQPLVGALVDRLGSFALALALLPLALALAAALTLLVRESRPQPKA
ncbi:MFS transporter [Albibacillus kandeliae]|uniref:MFS transporter n=1 Tax=Albibacillus kandeliae TaxID=2174228 RepID=UPI000D68F11C|nr:MFS transporter [Albibacillus kandeliae]